MVLLVPLAIYFSAPDNYFSKKSDSSPVIQTFDDERVEQTQKSQANIQLEKKSTSNKKSDFLSGIFKSEKKQQDKNETKDPEHIDIPMTAEHQEYLQDTYDELYSSQYSNDRDGHLPISLVG